MDMPYLDLYREFLKPVPAIITEYRHGNEPEKQAQVLHEEDDSCNITLPEKDLEELSKRLVKSKRLGIISIDNLGSRTLYEILVDHKDNSIVAGFIWHLNDKLQKAQLDSITSIKGSSTIVIYYRLDAMADTNFDWRKLKYVSHVCEDELNMQISIFERLYKNYNGFEKKEDDKKRHKDTFERPVRIETALNPK